MEMNSLVLEVKLVPNLGNVKLFLLNENIMTYIVFSNK
jgi:hypothetical protein